MDPKTLFWGIKNRCPYSTICKSSPIFSHSYITIFTPMISPLILHNPKIRSVTHKKHCMINPVCWLTSHDATSISLPSACTYWDSNRSSLESLLHLIICSIIDDKWLKSNTDCSNGPTDKWTYKAIRLVWMVTLSWDSTFRQL